MAMESPMNITLEKKSFLNEFGELKISGEIPVDYIKPTTNESEKTELIGKIPVEYIPPTIKLVIDMTEEEREQHFMKMGEEQYKKYLEIKKNGCYNRCTKTDHCKLARERKEKEEKQKDELIKTQSDKLNELQAVIIQQNQVLAQIIDKINKNI